MRIGIDCRTILNPGYGEHAGIGHYTFYLVSNLLKIDKKNQYVLFFDNLLSRNAAEEVIAGAANVQIRFFPFHRYKYYLPFAFSHLLVAGALEKEKLDVFHSPAYTLPLVYKGKSVVTVHDLAIYKHPEWFAKKSLVGRNFSTKMLVPQSLKKAKKIIAVSRHTKKDIQEIFRIKPEKIEVVYEGVEFRDLPGRGEEACGLLNKICLDDLTAKYGLSEDYILFLGTIEPRKNIETLIRAFCSLAEKDVGFADKYQLVLAGAKGWKYEKVFRAIEVCQKDLKNKAAVKYIGYVPGREKFALMKYAACFVFPSLYEGFGLPVLESLSLAVPTITSNTSALPEITGKGALLVDSKKSESIADALLKVLSNKKLREQLGKNGVAQAKKFSWEKCAQKTLAVYKSVIV
jgi:glycosyltransferase involved in cell wall biosynthesis